MHDVIKIDVKEEIQAENDRIASDTHALLKERNIVAVNVMGAPGIGKTSTVKGIISHLKAHRPYVIEGDIEGDIDTQDLLERGIATLQVNTFGACHLDAPMIRSALERMELEGPGLLLIENIGNLVCPAEFSIGEHIKLLIVAVTDGSDKPYKYPLAFEKADCILLNKVDLLPYVDFDQDYFMKGLRALNSEAPVFQVSGRTGEGYQEVAAWLESQ